jgi:hypothetical protein
VRFLDRRVGSLHADDAEQAELMREAAGLKKPSGSLGATGAAAHGGLKKPRQMITFIMTAPPFLP